MPHALKSVLINNGQSPKVVSSLESASFYLLKKTHVSRTFLDSSMVRVSLLFYYPEVLVVLRECTLSDPWSFRHESMLV